MTDANEVRHRNRGMNDDIERGGLMVTHVLRTCKIQTLACYDDL